MNHTITREQIKSLLDKSESMTLVEALPPQYYNKQHLPGAINLPHDKVLELAATLLPDKDSLIVVYCSNVDCKNSAIARESLEQMGYTNALAYVEGKQDWLEAGFPVESGRRAG